MDGPTNIVMYGGWTDRQTDKQTDGQTDGWTEPHIESLVRD